MYSLLESAGWFFTGAGTAMIEAGFSLLEDPESKTMMKFGGFFPFVIGLAILVAQL